MQNVITVNDREIWVNLDSPLALPCAGASIIKTPTMSGWANVMMRGDDLFINGKLTELFRSEEQTRPAGANGYDVNEIVQSKRTIHPNILDALYEYEHLVPDRYKFSASGSINIIYFWDAIFADSLGRPVVRSLLWVGKEKRKHFHFLAFPWDIFDFALIQCQS